MRTFQKKFAARLISAWCISSEQWGLEQRERNLPAPFSVAEDLVRFRPLPLGPAVAASVAIWFIAKLTCNIEKIISSWNIKQSWNFAISLPLQDWDMLQVSSVLWVLCQKRGLRHFLMQHPSVQPTNGKEIFAQAPKKNWRITLAGSIHSLVPAAAIALMSSATAE